MSGCIWKKGVPNVGCERYDAEADGMVAAIERVGPPDGALWIWTARRADDPITKWETDAEGKEVLRVLLPRASGRADSLDTAKTKAEKAMRRERKEDVWTCRS